MSNSIDATWATLEEAMLATAVTGEALALTTQLGVRAVTITSGTVAATAKVLVNATEEYRTVAGIQAGLGQLWDLATAEPKAEEQQSADNTGS